MAQSSHDVICFGIDGPKSFTGSVRMVTLLDPVSVKERTFFSPTNPSHFQANGQSWEDLHFRAHRQLKQGELVTSPPTPLHSLSSSAEQQQQSSGTSPSASFRVVGPSWRQRHILVQCLKRALQHFISPLLVHSKVGGCSGWMFGVIAFAAPLGGVGILTRSDIDVPKPKKNNVTPKFLHRRENSQLGSRLVLDEKLKI